MPIIIILGGYGLLGSSLAPALVGLGYKVIRQSRTDGADLCLDLLDRTALTAALLEYQPEAIINLVGLTNVDQCEIEPKLAWRANANVVKVLADCLEVVGEKSGRTPYLVHISTDQVYDGLGPHTEENIDLINVYALSKYVGELFAGRVGASVLRTNFYGRSNCKGRVSFSDWLVRSLRDRSPITVLDDVEFSAVHIDTLCSIIARCIESRPVGVFNAGCRDSISKAGFAFALAKALNLSTENVTVGTSADLTLKARRPLDMTLQVARLEAALDLQCPNMLNEIQYTAKEYLND
jgi:dTDP-4-dehydrorhamnose reductase